MTATPTEKPLALQLAKNLIQIHQSHADEGDTTFSESAAELERQNAEIARLTAENEALKAAVSDAVAEERMVCAELMEQQHTWITNVAASALIRARGTL